MTAPDVVVVGGGPAGVAAAIACANHGLMVTLIERSASPGDKPCGEGLLPNGVAALAGLGIGAGALASRGAPIAGIRYHSSRGHTAQASFNGPTGFGIRRTDLSRLLLARAKALPGLTVVTGQPARTSMDDAGRPLVQVGAATYRPKLLIGADGLQSRTRRATGIEVARRSGRRWGCRQHFDGDPWTDHVEVYFARGFEVYVTPVAGGVNVAALWDAALMQPGTGETPVLSLVAQVPALERRLRGRTTTDRARAAGPFDVRVRQPWRPGVLLLGDAAGYVDALTGEGVGAAFEQAVLLSDAVIPALRRTPRGTMVDDSAVATFWREAKRRSRANRLLTRLLVQIARHPALVEGSIAALGSSPRLFARLLDVNMGRGLRHSAAPVAVVGQAPSR